MKAPEEYCLILEKNNPHVFIFVETIENARSRIYINTRELSFLK
jgi:hypothetical protein